MAKSPHTPEWRAMVAKEYLDGKAPSPDIARYNISNWAVLNNWIQCYNANRERRDYVPEREVYMAGARKKQLLKNAGRLPVIV